MTVHVKKLKDARPYSSRGRVTPDWRFIGSVKYKMGALPFKKIDKLFYRIEEASRTEPSARRWAAGAD